MEPIDLINGEDSKKTKDSLDDILNELSSTPVEPQQPDVDDVLKTFEKNVEEDKNLEISIKDPDSNKKVKVSADTVLKGSVVMLLINIAVPSLIAVAHNKFATGYEPINKNDLKASKVTMKELEPLADEVFKSMEVKSSPMSLFLMGLAATYGLTYLNMLEKIPKKEDEGQGDNSGR